MRKKSSLPDITSQEGMKLVSYKDSQMGERPSSARPLPAIQKSQMGARPSSPRPLPVAARPSRPAENSSNTDNDNS